MPEHKHNYKAHMHMDGCHWYSVAYRCDGCGDVQHRGGERNFNSPDDPYARMFAVDDCPRCQELLKGAEPKVPS